MYEEIKEQIIVTAIFKNGLTLPCSFSWHEREYQIDNINLRHKKQQGKTTFFCFSVTAGGNTYELSLDNQNLIWILEKVWSYT